MKLKRLRQKGAAFYFDTQAKPRRWIPLGSDRALALKRYDELARAAPAAGSVGQMLRDYLTALKGNPATLTQYRRWAKHLEAVFGHLPAASLTQADVLQYLDLCPRANARGEVSVLSMAFTGWMRAGRLTFNPCIGVKAAKPRAKRTRLLTDAELLAIIDHAPETLRIAIELAYMTGLRIGDILALRWGQMEGDGHIRTRKTGARQRFTMTPDLRALLDRAKALQGRVGSVYVLSGRGGQPIKYDTLHAAWTKACAAAGVTDAHFHDLRAVAGTDAEAAGRNATKLLGHASEQTTRVYLRGKGVETIEPLPRKIGTK